MRPKKTILLACRDEVKCSLLRFLLQNHGYHVFGAGPEDVFTDMALIIDDAQLATEDLACSVHPDVPLLVLLRKDRAGVNYPTRAILMPQCIANIDLLDRIRMMMSRKRGPKKREHFVIPVVQQEAVTA